MAAVTWFRNHMNYPCALNSQGRVLSRIWMGTGRKKLLNREKIRCCISLFAMWLLDIIRETVFFLTVSAVLLAVAFSGWANLPREFSRRLFCRSTVFAITEAISYFTYRCAVGSLKNWETSPDISFGVCCGLEMLPIAALYAIPQI